jgi:hypothetical protein
MDPLSPEQLRQAEKVRADILLLWWTHKQKANAMRSYEV